MDSESDTSPYTPLQDALLDIFAILSKEEPMEDVLTTKADFINGEIFKFNKLYDYTYYEPLEMLVSDKLEKFVRILESTFQQDTPVLSQFSTCWKKCHNLEKWLSLALKRANLDPPPQILVVESFRRFIYSNQLVEKTIQTYLKNSVEESPQLIEIIKICCIIGVKPPEDNLEVTRMFHLHESEAIHYDEKTVSLESNTIFYSNVTIPEDDVDHLKNVQFYKNEIKSEPEGDFIDNIHEKWWGKWDILERHHGYIQWLFPIRHGGLNSHSQPMTKHEAEIFRNTPEIIARVKKSFSMMMHFLGIDVVDEHGKLAPNEKNWETRSYFLSRSSHNYLRLTRMMKCFTILDLESFKLNLISFFIEQIFKHKVLLEAMESLMSYWFSTISKESDLQKMEDLVMEYSGCKCDRSLYKYEVESWAEKFQLDVPARDWGNIDKPVVKFPEHESKYSKVYFEKQYVPTKYVEWKPKEEKLPDEDMEMGSLF